MITSLRDYVITKTTMYTDFQQHLQKTLNEIREAGLYKNERVIITPQSSGIAVEGGQKVINFCANNYLGLADNKELIEAAKARMDTRGYGMASVRFICGTQDTHKELERVISDFFGTEDTILYAACFDANGGLLLASDRRGCYYLRRSQPRFDHRWCASVQSRALPLC